MMLKLLLEDRKMKTIIAILLLTTTAFASPFSLENSATVLAGSGCPPGTSNITISPDGTTLSVLFDQFVAEAGGALAVLTDIKTCQLRIPLQVPSGYTLGVYKVDYRGYLLLPSQSYALLNVDYDLGGNNNSFHRRFTGARNQEFAVTDTIGAGQFRYLPCGGDRTVNIDLIASWKIDIRQRPSPVPQAMASLDSIDGAPKGGITYHFKTKKCN